MFQGDDMKFFTFFTAIVFLFIGISCSPGDGGSSIYGDIPDSSADNTKDDNKKPDKPDSNHEAEDDYFETEDIDEIFPDNDHEIFHDTDYVDDGDTINDDSENYNDSAPYNDEDILYPDDDVFVPDNESVPDESETDDNDLPGTVCGNNVLEEGEFCEKLDSIDCVSLNFEKYRGGTAWCNDSCSDWDTYSCLEHLDHEKSIFVDQNYGNNSNDGSKNNPLKTITAGLNAANSSPDKKTVIVSGGTFNENISLKSGISIHGGYSGSPDWIEGFFFETIIVGNTPAISAKNVSNINLVNITIISNDATIAGDSSYAVFIYNSENILLDNLNVKAGKGAEGVDGEYGTEGLDGNPGSQGDKGCESVDGWFSGIFCNKCSVPQGGEGGSSPCSMFGGKGGEPGKDNSYGEPGENGTGSSNNGGEGGIGHNSDDMCLFYTGLAIHGNDGEPGPHSTHGSGGKEFGTITEDGYITANGEKGEDGAHGQGGGGGGGGQGGSKWCKSYGSSGGGGGGGGCGGKGGKGGKGGGGSFAIIVHNSHISVLNSSFESSDGGDGGDAGTGALGGLGGNGGSGGPYGGSGEQDDAGCGGWGGNGANGRRGGHGGGGGGGPSIAVVISDSSVNGLNTSSFKTGNSGDGGASPQNFGLKGKKSSTYSF
jgi:hypothetical protein